MKAFYQHLVLVLKRCLYARRGEPYRFGDRTLRFVPGTRPVRMSYRDAECTGVRNDALQVALVLDHLREGDLALDIGAHAGQYGVLMTSRCGQSGRVVCFEPDPDARVKLEANVRLNPDCKAPEVVPAACSDRVGTVTFYTQGGNSQSSIAKSALPTDRTHREIQVGTIRLDDWLGARGYGTPALVKVDTEGAEIHVLRGMPCVLASPALVVCELHPFAWEEFGVSFGQLADIVAESRREMRWLDSGEIVKEPVKYGTVLIRRPA